MIMHKISLKWLGLILVRYPILIGTGFCGGWNVVNKGEADYKSILTSEARTGGGAPDSGIVVPENGEEAFCHGN